MSELAKFTAALYFAALLTTGCSLHTNADRQEFNAKAVRQTQAASAACFLQFGDASISLSILCSDSESPTTIVRVSR